MILNRQGRQERQGFSLKFKSFFLAAGSIPAIEVSYSEFP
jgi:hypothetical protein